MYNLLIVDDKKTVRNGLKRYVDWNELGFSVAGDFSSGLDAIKFIESECVDVLLTDIVMPDMSGLELIKEVRLINPQIKVLILSAYEKFEYAREAIRLGAFNYITKPIDFSRLKEEFALIRQLLAKENQESQQKKEQKDIVSEQFLNNLVNDYYQTPDDIFAKAASIDFHVENRTFCIIRVIIEATISMEGSSCGESLLLIKARTAAAISDILNASGKAYVFNSGLSELSVLFFPERADILKEEIEKCSQRICSSPGVNAIFGVGRPYSVMSSAAASYREAGKSLAYRIIKKYGSVLFYEDITGLFKGKAIITNEIEENIISCLSLQQEALLKELVENIITSTYTVGQSHTNILYDVCIEILLIVNKFLNTNVDSKNLSGQNDYLSVKTLLQQQGFPEIKAFMSGYLTDCFNLIRKCNDRSAGLIVENVKKYIDQHYSEEITLNRLSEIVYVNPVYLSRLFKEKVGENFIEYLTRVRIEHAKKLLEDLSLRIYDITEMIGYESRKHFWKTFKDITGLSPKEYRNERRYS